MLFLKGAAIFAIFFIGERLVEEDLDLVFFVGTRGDFLLSPLRPILLKGTSKSSLSDGMFVGKDECLGKSVLHLCQLR